MKVIIVALSICIITGLITWLIGSTFLTGFIVTLVVILFFGFLSGGYLFDYFNRFPTKNQKP